MAIKKRSLIYLVFLSFIAFSICMNTAAEGQGDFQNYGDLFSKIQSHGGVRVIIKLKIPFSPEGELSAPAAVLDQQTQILESQNQLISSLSGYKVSGVKRFKYIPYIAMEVNSQALSALITNPLVESIQEDIAVPPTLLQSIPLINADDAWALGYTGSGWVVAILDTGVDKTHTFLSGKVVSEACFSTTNASYSSTTLCPNNQESQIGSGAGVNCSSISGCAHGTHVAGIAAGKAATINGVAKDANIIAIQVFSRFNNPSLCGSTSPCVLSWTSDQILALEHVYSLRTTYNIAASNMSLGGGAYSSYCDSTQSATKAAIDNLRSVGIATTISSGNNGYCNAIGAPACISSAVSVGATTKTDEEASYSNYASILSLFAPGSSILSSVPGDGWQSWSGTSMAAPHVAGAWAVLKQAIPSASVTEILNSLKNNGVSIPNACLGSGYYPQKRIDILAALNSLIAIPPAAPSGLTATGVSTSQINLSWTDNSNNETGFKIERKTGSGGIYSEIAIVGANVKSYSDTSLTVNTTYYYRVRAYNAIGNSPYSNEAIGKTLSCNVTFGDVPSGYWAEYYIKNIYCKGITSGCSTTPLLYCPESYVTRAQMAAFIIRALHGETFSYSSTAHFSDVSNTHWAFKYIQKMFEEGISTGYGDGTYRPNNNVTRAEMAAFIIRSLYGETFSYSSTAHFSDVSNTHWAFKYIQKMFEEGISTGYGDGTYGPNNNVTRAEMAAFLTRAFP